MSDRGGKGTLEQIAVLYDRMAEQAAKRESAMTKDDSISGTS